jgi:polar amino acid transport system ATP-binding protein
VPDAIVEIRGLRKSFGSTEVLRGIDLDVRKGEAVAVIGASGSGKTTMLRCINRLETYDTGSIRVDGIEIGYRTDSGTSSPVFAPTSAWFFSCSTCSHT